nr:MAG TPA: hypothetical protein [Caudoviricetes sp.]
MALHLEILNLLNPYNPFFSSPFQNNLILNV